MKVLIVFGTRPEAIKMCPLVKYMQEKTNIDVQVCVTGQHKEMLQQVIDIFDVVPKYDLQIMKEGQDLFEISDRILMGMKQVLVKEKPNVVLVHGDTSTAFVAALASFYLKIPVGHVEAGLRTYNIMSPYPEEFNRRAISLIAKYHFAPTEWAKTNLIKEGICEEDIYVTGNTVIDAMNVTLGQGYSSEDLKWASDSKMILVTAHRRENLGMPMTAMFRAIRKVATELPNVKIVYPVHLNPAVRNIAEKELSDCANIRLIKPLDVVAFHHFLQKSTLVLTDSGGIQEEAAALHVPTLVMRDTTERPEGITAGALKLTGTSEKKIYEMCKELLEKEEVYARMKCAVNPFGDGKAVQRIIEVIEKI